MTVDQFVFLAVTMGGGRVRSFNTGWKKFSPQTRNDRITQCDSVYVVKPPRGSSMVYPLLSLEVATPENNESKLSSVCKKVSLTSGS